jgi:transposase-like protein
LLARRKRPKSPFLTGLITCESEYLRVSQEPVMSRKPNAELHALWRDRIDRQVISGLSIEEFCAQEQFARSAFYRWRHLLGSGSKSAKTTPTSPTPSTFLPVRVRLVENDPFHSAPIEADLPNGIRLRIPTANIQLACRLIRSVAAAKTGSGGPQ